MIVMTAACIVCGFWLNKAIRQRAAVRRFYELTASRQSDLTTMGYRHRGKDQYYKPILPNWLRPLRAVMGEEAFGEVTGVQLTSTLVTNDDLRFVKDVPSVERLWLGNTQVTDEGLRHLRDCPKLRFLVLDGLPITDQGLAELSHLQELESMSLNSTQITDAGLLHLEKFSKLKELWLRNTAITDEGYQRLQAALPECHIQADVPTYFQGQHMYYWGSPSRE